MSAEIIPMPAPSDPVPSNITPMPQTAPVPAPGPPPIPAAPATDAISKLLKNPFVIAGGALLAGMALTRLLATPSMQKLARDLADEALKRARDAASTVSQTPAPSLLEEAVESVRPQITNAARNFLLQILRKS